MGATIIAECGLNHGGSLAIALKMAVAAKECGANIVKFQTFDPGQVPPLHPARKQVIEAALTRHETMSLSRSCADIGIEFLSTPGDVDSLRFLVGECGVNRIKIGSDDMLNWPLLDASAKTGLPLIVSTGMASLDEIVTVARWLPFHQNWMFMQCTSLYPCPPELVNLTAIHEITEYTGRQAGYSDHTSDTLACIAAVAMGATIIEKHFMLTDMPLPIDATVSASQFEFAAMVRDIRAVETMLGDGRKVHRPEEDEARRTLRKVVEGVQ